MFKLNKEFQSSEEKKAIDAKLQKNMSVTFSICRGEKIVYNHKTTNS